MATLKQIMRMAQDQKLIGRCRKREMVYMRYYLFSELRKELTLETIGKLFKMNHSTVLYGLKQHDQFMRMNDRIYINTVSQLFEDLNKFSIQELDGNNIHMQIINDEDQFITMEVMLYTKHADIYRDNQGIISREILKEML
jgi:hypothetical protein